MHFITVIPSLVTTCIGFFNLKQLDASRKNTQISYEISPEYNNIFNNINQSITELHKSKQVLFYDGKLTNLDPKYNFGVRSLPILKEATIKMGKPPNININMDVWHIQFSIYNLYFLPDQILLLTDSSVKGINYSELTITSGLEEIIWEENSKISTDCKIIGYVTKYNNKDGSSDKRFSNNINVPVIEYGFIELSLSGTNFKFFVSDQNIGPVIKNKLETPKFMFEQSLAKQKLINDQIKNQNSFYQNEIVNFSNEETQILIDIICCIIFADGKINDSELKAFMYILNNLNIKTNESKLKKQITAFYNLIKEKGFNEIFSDVCEKIKLINEQNKKDLILHHLNTIATADNDFHKNEKIVYNKLKEILQQLEQN